MANDAETPRAGELSVALATFLFLLHARGQGAADPEIAGACQAIADLGPDADADATGQLLVDLIDARLAGTDFDSVQSFLGGLLGADKLSSDLGDSRDERARNMRRYHFGHNQPWLAQIIDRFPDGEVGAHWVLVERVSDVVTCADPYPWDDLDEEYDAPLNDFMVKWELLNCPSIRYTG